MINLVNGSSFYQFPNYRLSNGVIKYRRDGIYSTNFVPTPQVSSLGSVSVPATKTGFTD